MAVQAQRPWRAPRGAPRTCFSVNEPRDEPELSLPAWTPLVSTRRLPPSVLATVLTTAVWEQIIDCLSIAYGSRPRLRPAYPAAECPCGGTLRLAVGGVLAPRIVTHSGIRTSHSSTARLRGRFAGEATLPYRAARKERHS